MKIYAISDLHLSFSTDKPMDVFGEEWVDHHIKIKESSKMINDEDILVIAGDISWALKIDNIKEDFEYLKSLPGKKIIIRGNHDYWWQSITKVRDICDENTFALQNDAVKIDNYIFFGSRGWTVSDSNNSTKEDLKIYKRELERMKLAVACAKKLETDGDTLIGVTHYPPFNVNFDPTEMTKIFSDAGIKTVIYGHLHGKDSKTKNIVVIDDVEYHLTSCDFLNFQIKKMI
ncbi:MAG: metallophosphoesterase [Bacillota bacterium]